MAKLLTQTEVETILKELGMSPKQARIGGAITLCEAPAGRNAIGELQSNFSAIGDQELANEVYGYSYGGFQIRSLRDQKGTGQYRDEDKLIRPRFNCRSAKIIHGMSGWKPWTTFVTGQYKAYLQDLYPPPEGVYVVLSGDSLSSIADAISDDQWTWEDLARVNNLHSPYTIYINQHLTLP